MSDAKVNPLEELTLEFAERWADMVEEFAAAVAPYHPWWHAVLTPDQQVYRWMQIREPIITWLADAAPFMGWPTPAAALDGLYELFTSRAAYDAVPPDLWIDPRFDGCRELVQAGGPREAAKHIKNVERMVQNRAAAAAAAQPQDRYGIPAEPPAPPYELAPIP